MPSCIRHARAQWPPCGHPRLPFGRARRRVSSAPPSCSGREPPVFVPTRVGPIGRAFRDTLAGA
eukprot:8757362-Heterocapsa_arctica.AAC.1